MHSLLILTATRLLNLNRGLDLYNIIFSLFEVKFILRNSETQKRSAPFTIYWVVGLFSTKLIYVFIPLKLNINMIFELFYD